MTLRFSDGINIDTSGKFRKFQLDDGWYVAGEGILMPCKDEDEADDFKQKLEEKYGYNVEKRS